MTDTNLGFSVPDLGSFVEKAFVYITPLQHKHASNHPTRSVPHFYGESRTFVASDATRCVKASNTL